MTTRTLAVYSLKSDFCCRWASEINQRLIKGDGTPEIIWRDAMETKRLQSREHFYESAMALSASGTRSGTRLDNSSQSVADAGSGPRAARRYNMKSCFGTIYPDMEKLKFGEPLAGKVFQICVDSLGPGHRDRKLAIDVSAWQACQQCQDFANCRDFSSAKLEMQRVIREL